MSLREAYSLAHTASYRLHIATTRPDRDLRFVVGHLMHYESLRLRIVEIEHSTAITKARKEASVAFRGAGVGEPRKTSNLKRGSPPPPAILEEDESDEDLEDEEEGGLGLTRFPSGSGARPMTEVAEPELDFASDSDEDSDDEPVSPEEPDQATLERVVKGEGNDLMAGMYNGVLKCACHQKGDAPTFEKVWELPTGEEGVTRLVAQVAG